MSEKVQRLIFSHSFFFSHETPNKQKKSRFRSGTLSKIMPTGSMLKKLSMVTIVLSTMVDTELMWPKFLVYVSDTLNDTLNQHHIIYVRKSAAAFLFQPQIPKFRFTHHRQYLKFQFIWISNIYKTTY